MSHENFWGEGAVYDWGDLAFLAVFVPVELGAVAWRHHKLIGAIDRLMTQVHAENGNGFQQVEGLLCWYAEPRPPYGPYGSPPTPGWGDLGGEKVQRAEGLQDTGGQVSRTAFREAAGSLSTVRPLQGEMWIRACCQGC